MAKGSKSRRRFSRQYRSSPYPMPSTCWKSLGKEANQKKSSKAAEILEKRDWEDANCSVCMEFPHNAVLLLCSSHDKGCRPYMCGTSYRYSNCLDQYKRAYTKVTSPPPNGQHGQFREGLLPRSTENTGFGSGPDWVIDKCDVMELACPLCRGQVKGWTVVEAARTYLNTKKRTCTQDDCSFVGTYKELRKHVRAVHPCARPRQVDPHLEQKWRMLERERDREDVISTIRSSMPGAMVLGDYVIERGDAFDSDEGEGEFDDDEDNDDNDDYEVGAERHWLNLLFLFQAIGGTTANMSLSSRLRRLDRVNHRILIDDDSADVPAGSGAAVATSDNGDPIRHGRMVHVGRSERRRRRHRSRRRSLTDLT